MHYVYAIASIVLTGIILRSIACSTHLYREVYISAGRLACHHKYQGAFPHPVSQRNSCRVRLLLLCSSCRDGQDMVTPTVISPLFHSSPSSSSTCSPVFWTNFPCWPRKRLSNMILCITSDLHRHFGATSAVLFMATASIHIIPFMHFNNKGADPLPNPADVFPPYCCSFDKLSPKHETNLYLVKVL